ncbi:MAG: amidase [Dehalococcoidales bacterium]|nr:amidase [Dehalococcoidales bacterium]
MTSGYPYYDKYDGLGLAELVKKNQVKPTELVEEAISRIEKLNPQLNAVVHKMYDSALKTAGGDLPDGPFKGVPFLLKDLMAFCKDEPMTNGSRFFKNFVPDFDSELVSRYRKAGIIIVGKTNTPEFGLAFVTEPELHGPARNPWDLTRTTGGSSGGSAASVAARIVPMAHGGDGGGSIRIPSSCCGVFGLKPTRGRNPLGPYYGDAWRGFVSEHIITRSVRDSAAMLYATCGPDTGAPYWCEPPESTFLSKVEQEPEPLRIAYTAKPFFSDSVDADCVKGLEETVKLCGELGHEAEEAAPGLDYIPIAQAFVTVVCSETRAMIEQAERDLNRKASYGDFETETWICALLGRQCRASDLSKALNLIQTAGREIGRFFENYDVLLTPATAAPPLPLGFSVTTGFQSVAMKVLARLNAGGMINMLGGIPAFAEQAFVFAPYTPLFNATGQPAMSVPLYWNDDGLPIGMQFAGRYGDETTLFRLAAQLEKARPWADRIPPVCTT